MAAPQPCADSSCCSHPGAVPGVQQTLEEMDFERGIWSAALNGDLGRVKYFIQKATDPSQPDSAGYTALAAEKGHEDICSLLLQHSPALKAVRDRKARLACDLLPCNSGLRDLLAI
ncbi:hypothetical protein A6R68_13039 [Neotoma lepida]|uniref:Ankyrin repeat domain-containing protein 39 n=1 Tax=Neotoma lepida TaxID=56216 RepID=A0A1A6H474_NEOLE|nr:hypothetical protein A6R68_13039 [Neotoma lepida]